MLVRELAGWRVTYTVELFVEHFCILNERKFWLELRTGLTNASNSCLQGRSVSNNFHISSFGSNTTLNLMRPLLTRAQGKYRDRKMTYATSGNSSTPGDRKTTFDRHKEGFLKVTWKWDLNMRLFKEYT